VILICPIRLPTRVLTEALFKRDVNYHSAFYSSSRRNRVAPPMAGVLLQP